MITSETSLLYVFIIALHLSCLFVSMLNGTADSIALYRPTLPVAQNVYTVLGAVIFNINGDQEPQIRSTC